MNIDQETHQLVLKEKAYTAKIIKNLAWIQERKLFSDWGYHSLYHYCTKRLKYSEAEASIRVGAVRLARKVPGTIKKIEKGSLGLTNASKLNHAIEKGKLG